MKLSKGNSPNSATNISDPNSFGSTAKWNPKYVFDMFLFLFYNEGFLPQSPQRFLTRIARINPNL
jgi:hypothetical protein